MLWLGRNFIMEHTHLIYSLSFAGRECGRRYTCVYGSCCRPASTYIAGSGCNTTRGHSFWWAALRAGLFWGIQCIMYAVYNVYSVSSVYIYMYTCTQVSIYSVMLLGFHSGNQHTQEQVANHVRVAEQEQVPADVLLCLMQVASAVAREYDVILMLKELICQVLKGNI